jgi:hypothetical protein
MGKGATYQDKGNKSTLLHKFSSQPTRTKGAFFLDEFIRNTAWGMATLTSRPSASASIVVKGNRFTSVPKDSSKNRGICVEPSLNLSYQLPLGSLFKRRLLSCGIDLIDGQQLHRRLAQKASIDGSLATIDLSNASDTISYVAVKLLLPAMWFDLLDSLRSPFTKVGDEWVKLEKFSSMGNGFTFELETILFFSLVAAVAERHGFNWREEVANHRIAVYGDDIIAPVEYANDVLAVLQFFGFTPNRKKTFLRGPFRESCGGDFFNGVDVRPFYLKELPNEPTDWITLANGLRRLDFTDIVCGPGRLGLNSAWHRCLDSIPAHIRRIRGPRALGDVVIHDHPEFWTTRPNVESGFVEIATWTPVTRKLGYGGYHGSVVLACALYGTPSSGVTPRDAVTGYRKRWTSLLERSET